FKASINILCNYRIVSWSQICKCIYRIKFIQVGRNGILISTGTSGKGYAYTAIIGAITSNIRKGIVYDQWGWFRDCVFVGYHYTIITGSPYPVAAHGEIT